MKSRTPRLYSQQFLMPKEGATPEECEDAVGVNPSALSYALADGATEAFDAGAWARQLAAGWVAAAVAPVSVEEFGAWAAAEGVRLAASWAGRELPWYAEEKARAGSFAAFVGIHFEARSAGGLGWRAVALGDACLFCLRAGAIRTALPLGSHRDFNSAPPLVPTSEALLAGVLGRAASAAGEAAPGDTFLLLSDAAAAWFLELTESRRERVREFDSLLAASQNKALTSLVREERAAGRMKDDDVAAVRIAVGPGAPRRG